MKNLNKHIEVFMTFLWFTIDTLWLLEIPKEILTLVSVIGIIVATIIVAIKIFLFLKYQTKHHLVNSITEFAIYSWFIMNQCWMLGETHSAKIALIYGIIFLIISLFISSTDTLNLFKRFRNTHGRS